MEPVLAIIDIDIQGGQDERTREGLLEGIRSFEGDCVLPLWINMLQERADLRVVCLVYDLSQLDDFLMDVVRSVPGVRGTSGRLAFAGYIDGDVFSELPLLEQASTASGIAATIDLRSEPGRDRKVFEGLVSLPQHPKVRVAWAMQLFHSSRTDMSLLLLADDLQSLNAYVMSWVRTVPGITDTDLILMSDWEVVGNAEHFVAAAERYARQVTE